MVGLECPSRRFTLTTSRPARIQSRGMTVAEAVKGDLGQFRSRHRPTPHDAEIVPDQDRIATKDWVREKCGLPAWKPAVRGSKPDPIAFKTRNMFVGEICRRRHQNGQNIEFEWFCLLANDVMQPSGRGH